jgi:serine/threonine protein kinase
LRSVSNELENVLGEALSQRNRYLLRLESFVRRRAYAKPRRMVDALLGTAPPNTDFPAIAFDYTSVRCGLCVDAARCSAPIAMYRQYARQGTPVYIAPEQFKSFGPPSPRTDQWAFGVVPYC